MTVKFFITISLGQAKNFLHFDLMQKIQNCLTQDNVLGEYYQNFQTAFSAAYTRLDEAMLISRKSMLTPEIQRLDEQRVQLWRVIRASAKEQEKLDSQTVATAANFVMSLINNHGDVQAMRVTERTGALTNLAQDLTQKYAEQVAEVSLTGFAEQLSTVNAEYLRLYEQRLHEWSEYTNKEVATAREAIDVALENLCIMVASGILTQGMAPFKHFVDYVNEAIKVAKIAMGATTTKPEGDTGGTGGEGGGSSEEERVFIPVTFKYQNNTTVEREYYVGQRVTEADAPEPAEGMAWKYLPFTMPEVEGIVITDCPDYDVEDYRKITIRWKDSAAGINVEQEYSIGEIVEAPEPPAGKHWDTDIIGKPAVPMRVTNIFAVAD